MSKKTNGGSAVKAIKSKERWTRGCTGRINRLRDAYMERKPEVDVERAVSYTKTYKTTEADDYIIRRAKAHQNYFREKTVDIYPDDLIAGTHGKAPKAAVVFPDMSWKWVMEEMDSFPTRPQDPYEISDESKKLLKEIVFPYWDGRAIQDYCMNNIGDDTLKAMIEETSIISCIHIMTGVGEFAPGYGSMLFEKGFRGIENEARERLANISDYDGDAHDKAQVYRAIIISCETAKLIGKRYAKRARELAAETKDEQRRAELLEMARMCDKVPYDPPETFAEAIQFVWLSQMLIWIEEGGSSICIDRPDQYLYPFYKKEKEAGTLTDVDAQEYIEALWIKMAEVIGFRSSVSSEIFAGYQAFHGLTIGGVDKKGNNACNELTNMMLQATMDVGLNSPSVNVRIGKDAPNDFIEKLYELVKIGMGQPAIYFDNTAIELIKNVGVTLEDANNWCIGGCIEPQVPSKMHRWTEGGRYSFANSVEWVLSNGYSKVYDRDFGLKTGDPRDFKTFEEFKEAAKKQTAYLINCVVRLCRIAERSHQIRLPKPMLTTMTEGCLESGRDTMSGGAVYNLGPGLETTGIADIADSLMAVKKLVYDEKKITMDELIKALEADFVGFEEIRQLLINGAPKYGNDEDEVDEFASEFMDFSVKEASKYKSILDKPYETGAVPVIANLTHGKACWALPNGRKAGEPLADGMSPFSGYDTNGPTSIIKSVCKPDHIHTSDGNLLNIKLSPSIMNSAQDMDNFKALLKGEEALGGYHVQFNVLDNKELRKAQKTPEKYQDLIVRVAGYSAFFVQLHKNAQETIIGRTEQSAW